jgi:hypothetical protein
MLDFVDAQARALDHGLLFANVSNNRSDGHMFVSDFKLRHIAMTFRAETINPVKRWEGYNADSSGLEHP